MLSDEHKQILEIDGGKIKMVTTTVEEFLRDLKDLESPHDC
jgi:hypothetical protein